MANYKVAYGRKENMNLAIETGVIPTGSIILLEDSPEIYFYDLNKNLKQYQEKYKFESYEDAEEWVDRYNCAGQILSVHEEGKCNLYIVNYDNKLSKLSSYDYIVSDKNPTIKDSNHDRLTYWINVNTDELFILVSIKDSGDALWKSVCDKTFTFVQAAPSDIWVVNHSLNKYPSVTLVDDTNNLIVGDTEYIDSNSLRVKFTSRVSGKAYIN